ncbi:Pre-mRNA-processing factor 19 [Durusdinium trenchii]|uniref:Pre-mRNA-processing factor 19 n=1 Tax=Durusdinium trenchii TaxID=1381693 RepID=A0ABP0IGH0_9DINO
MAEGVEDIFGYNRGNFMFDQKLRQWREYQEQNMRVKQFMLYREDMRDLTELTISKMDSYLMIAVLELGCCLDLLVHGVLHIHSVQSASDRVTA